MVVFIEKSPLRVQTAMKLWKCLNTDETWHKCWLDYSLCKSMLNVKLYATPKVKVTHKGQMLKNTSFHNKKSTIRVRSITFKPLIFFLNNLAQLTTIMSWRAEWNNWVANLKVKVTLYETLRKASILMKLGTSVDWTIAFIAACSMLNFLLSWQRGTSFNCQKSLFSIVFIPPP
jgi:hypothetical protein